jgi:pseudaminic acid cytidylyltransferase
MKNIAIIPARGGSKRILRKNIKDFLGKPIIAYSIEAAIDSGLFDEVMVSTDDKEIAETAIKFGANVPFFRNNTSADDFAGLEEVIVEVLSEYHSLKTDFDFFCCILPTAPFISTNRLKQALDLLIKNNFDSVFPVVKYSYPIQRALKIENEKMKMIWPENMEKRSQDLYPAYHDSGQFYWMNVNQFLIQKKLFAENAGAVIISENEAQDIDTFEDWEIAELKYKHLKSINFGKNKST